MSIRESIGSKQGLSIAAAVALVLAAGVILVVQFKPERKARLGVAFYTVDDGTTWFEDSAFRVAPFSHEGREAVIAHVFTYANGSKRFVAYLTQFTPEAKARLEAALAAARAENKPPESVPLFTDRNFLRTGLLYKKPGSPDWVRGDDPKVTGIQTITSPDGSEVDQLFAY